MSIEARERFVVHRVSTNEFGDLAVLARVRGESRSQMLRQLVVEEKQRLVEALGWFEVFKAGGADAPDRHR